MSVQGAQNAGPILQACLDAIDAYRSGKLSLARLVLRLETLLEREEMPKEVRDEYYQQWCALEEVNAVLLDAKRDELNEIEKNIVEQSVSVLKRLVEVISAK